MRNLILRAYAASQVILDALKGEDGQDLIEYALVISLIALGATAGMGTIANSINNAFNTLSTRLSQTVT